MKLCEPVSMFPLITPNKLTAIRRPGVTIADTRFVSQTAFVSTIPLVEEELSVRRSPQAAVLLRMGERMRYEV